MLNIEITSKRVHFNITLRKKITIIRGDSGKGKTIFAKSAEDDSGVYRKKLSDESFSLQVISGPNWIDILSSLAMSKKRYVFICDDADFVTKSEFSSIVSHDEHNYYMIINRFVTINMKSLSQLPFSVDEVYFFKTSGKNHWIEPLYLFHSTYQSAYDVVVTEDEASGLKFLRAYNRNVSTTKGKDKVIKFLKTNRNILTGKRIFLFIDFAAFGAAFDLLLVQTRNDNLNITIMPEYASFEYLLLASNFYKFDFDNITDYEMLRHFSHERLYSSIIARLSSGWPYFYNALDDKGSLSTCYTQDCCKRGKSEPCDRGMPGDKLESLFAGTVFEKLFDSIKSSSLVRIS